jgi:hypothetical protein
VPDRSTRGKWLLRFRVTLQTSDDRISLITFTDTVMINAQFLRHKVHNPPLLGTQRTGECQFIAHVVVLEEEDTRIDLESGGIVKIQFRLGRLGARGWDLHRDLLVHIRLRDGHVSEVGRRVGRDRNSSRDRKAPSRSTDWRLNSKVVVMGMGCRLSQVLLFHLHGFHAPNSFFAFDTFFLAGLQHLFVLNPKLASLNIEPVERGDNSVGILGETEVGESETAEGTSLVKMVVEGIRSGDRKGCNDVQESLAFNVERDVFDYDSSWDDFVVQSTASPNGLGERRGRGRRSRARRKVGRLRRGQRPFVGRRSRVVHPSRGETSTILILAWYNGRRGLVVIPRIVILGQSRLIVSIVS